MTFQNTLSELSDPGTDVKNESVPQGCTTIRFSDWEYLPWDNSDNIVSEEVQSTISRARASILQILFLIGGPANVINMAVFFKQNLKDRVNLLLFTLSLADELYLIMAMLLYSEEVYSQFTRKINPGLLFVFIVNSQLSGFTGFCFVSWVLSAIIACERCCCVVWPLKYQTLMRTRTLAVLIIAVYVVVLGLHFLVVSRYYITCVYDPDTGVVSKMFSHAEFYRRHKDLVDYVDSVVFGVGLASAVVTVVTAATVITTWKLRQAVAWRSETTSSVSVREVALTKMLIGTSVLFLVCISPACLRRVASLFLPEMSTGRRYENLFFACLWISQILDFINSSFNIFIYYGMSSRYREVFWALFKRKAKPKSKMTRSSSSASRAL